jgi:hypothetical protein
LRKAEILLLSRDELIAAIGRGEIHLLTQIALVSMVWQSDIAKALGGVAYQTTCTFSDATAAVGRLQEIYERNTRFLNLP